MKEKLNFFTVVVSLLLISSIVLTGCILSITSDTGDTKPYDYTAKGDDITDGDASPDINELEQIVDNAPTSQFFMKKKFHSYLHEDGNKVTVCSQEQYGELQNVRRLSKRNPLTYEEILFLINDSINMYFSYDEISLSYANTDGILPSSLTFAMIQSTSACIINPYRGDYSEFENYYDAKNTYNRVIQEIYAIIYYRIYLHDSGFAKIYRCSDDTILGQSSYATADPEVIYQILAIDSSNEGGLENEEKLINEYEKIVQWEREQSTNYIDPDKELPKLNSKVLATKTMNDERKPMEFTFVIYDTDNTVQVVYPPSELENMTPRREIYYESITEFGNSNKPIFSLNREDKTFAMSASSLTSFALVGSFTEYDDVLKLYPENAGEASTYSYVFHKNGDKYVYIQKDSKSIALSGFVWPDGLVFEMVYDGISNRPIPEPPSNDEQNSTETDTGDSCIDGTVETETAELKFDANSNYCSLMINGNSVIDGSYIKEDNKLVFLFKTADGLYQYYFERLEEDVYAYQKGLSIPYPGYEIEDEIKFRLSASDNCSSCYLEVIKN